MYVQVWYHFGWAQGMVQGHVRHRLAEFGITSFWFNVHLGSSLLVAVTCNKNVDSGNAERDESLPEFSNNPKWLLFISMQHHQPLSQPFLCNSRLRPHRFVS